MEKLTKTEEQIMQIIWKLKKAYVKDIIAALPGKEKPPYNTISSIVRLLEEKGFVGYKAYGRTHEYFPLVTKKAYRKKMFNSFFRNYFDGSMEQLASFFANEKNVDAAELKKLLEEMDKPGKSNSKLNLLL